MRGIRTLGPLLNPPMFPIALLIEFVVVFGPPVGCAWAETQPAPIVMADLSG